MEKEYTILDCATNGKKAFEPMEKHRSNIVQKLNLEPKTNTLLIWAKENQEHFKL